MRKKNRRENIAKERKNRRDEVVRKYGDTPVAQGILNRTPWIGQTKGQLVDSFGGADEIELKESARTSKEIWKFFYPGSRRIKLKITITNGQVSHIDSK